MQSYMWSDSLKKWSVIDRQNLPIQLNDWELGGQFKIFNVFEQNFVKLI